MWGGKGWGLVGFWGFGGVRCKGRGTSGKSLVFRHLNRYKSSTSRNRELLTSCCLSKKKRKSIYFYLRNNSTTIAGWACEKGVWEFNGRTNVTDRGD